MGVQLLCVATAADEALNVSYFCVYVSADVFSKGYYICFRHSKGVVKLLAIRSKAYRKTR